MNTSPGGMYVISNVFAQGRDGALTTPGNTSLTQTGLVDGGQNVFQASLQSFWDTSSGAPCDFDGDSVNDPFRASGVSWWYYSSRARRWVALDTTANTAVAFSDVNHDGLCDVTSAAGTT